MRKDEFPIIDKHVKNEINAVLDKIRAEIERLHYHPKLDFIENDAVVDMAFEIIDKYRNEVNHETVN